MGDTARREAPAACRRPVHVTGRRGGIPPRPTTDLQMKPKLTALAMALATLVALLAGSSPAAAGATPENAAPQEHPAVAAGMVVRPAGARVESWSQEPSTSAAAESLADPVAEPPAAEPADPVPPVDPAPMSEPVPVEPEPEPTQPGPAEAEPSEPAGSDATAVNDSLTVQVLVQVQRGCRSHCHGTSQTQVADQAAQTTQDASARADAEGGEALAANRSRSLQFVWQAQLGCVAFCYGTSQLQLAGLGVPERRNEPGRVRRTQWGRRGRPRGAARGVQRH